MLWPFLAVRRALGTELGKDTLFIDNSFLLRPDLGRGSLAPWWISALDIP